MIKSTKDYIICLLSQKIVRIIKCQVLNNIQYGIINMVHFIEDKKLAKRKFYQCNRFIILCSAWYENNILLKLRMYIYKVVKNESEWYTGGIFVTLYFQIAQDFTPRDLY